MTFEPPPTTRQMRALMATTWPIPYLLKGIDDDDLAWNLVREAPIGRLMPNPEKDGFLPEEVTVNFDDGSVRLFESNDQVLVGPVTNRIGGDRQEIREVADAHGWQRPPDDNKDLFTRGLFSVEVYYEADTADTARRLRAGKQITLAFTGPSAKVAALDWLKSTQPDEV